MNFYLFLIFFYTFLFYSYMCWFLSPKTLLNSQKRFFSFFYHLVNRYAVHKIYTVNFRYFSIEKEIQKPPPLNVQQSFHNILKNLYITYREKDLLIADLFFCFYSYRVQLLKRRLDWIYTRSNRTKAWVAYGLFHLSWFSF